MIILLSITRGGMGARRVLKQAHGVCMLCFTDDVVCFLVLSAFPESFTKSF